MNDIQRSATPLTPNRKQKNPNLMKKINNNFTMPPQQPNQNNQSELMMGPCNNINEKKKNYAKISVKDLQKRNSISSCSRNDSYDSEIDAINEVISSKCKDDKQPCQQLKPYHRHHHHHRIRANCSSSNGKSEPIEIQTDDESFYFNQMRTNKANTEKMYNRIKKTHHQTTHHNNHNRHRSPINIPPSPSHSFIPIKNINQKHS